ncbi:hypothetical protein E1B28_012790 [Marasmius oreades]|uniref:Uncharacterized protein n=1 Tax=Marasmius oreades TaxID=181124 RepID=A0A9P7UPB4_9AGAR|nr:uncharacterized protein E1B28_012790 [Marasmius oreades]KAG7088835.1 hypothetical protein E1B28_012790 [Marasmius oreades]
MDSNRKSTVSSFYGRKTSMDALNSDFPSPSTPNIHNYQQARGRDDVSSFYDAEHRNLDNGQPGTAGYNRNSFFFAGREEPVKGGRDEEDRGHGEAWDVYADFNNAGPKYSSVFDATSQEGYQPLAHTPKAEDASTIGPVELVTVPAMGPEWKREEMHNMTKKSRKANKAEARATKWKEWNRGNRGWCGGWLTRRVLVIVVFIICAIIGIILAFVIPRVPKLAFNSDHPLANATGSWEEAVPLTFQRSPANFSFAAFADLQVDTTASYVPIKFNPLHAEVYDTDTNRKVGSGDLSLTLPPKRFNNILLPLNFSYIASNDTDQTWRNWYDACKNQGASPGGVRKGLKFRLVVEMHIFGLIGTQKTSTPVSNVACPIELPITSV